MLEESIISEIFHKYTARPENISGKSLPSELWNLLDHIASQPLTHSQIATFLSCTLTSASKLINQLVELKLCILVEPANISYKNWKSQQHSPITLTAENISLKPDDSSLAANEDLTFNKDEDVIVHPTAKAKNKLPSSTTTLKQDKNTQDCKILVIEAEEEISLMIG